MAKSKKIQMVCGPRSLPRLRNKISHPQMRYLLSSIKTGEFNLVELMKEFRKLLTEGLWL
jgi:hypothetical protein